MLNQMTPTSPQEYACAIMGLGLADKVPTWKQLDKLVAAYPQREFILSMKRDTHPLAIQLLRRYTNYVRAEELAHRPTPTPKNKPARKRKPVSVLADHTIVEVQPNPKKAGSASYARYARYEAGKTVSENVAIHGGPTMADVKWDAERGFIKLEKK